MVSLVGAEQLDEAHCLWALCSHPCCWEAERRIAKGIYRRALRVPTKHSAEERLPSLTVVDVSEWAGMRTVSSDRTYLSRIPFQAVPPWKDTTLRFKTTDPSFPAITSAAAKSHTRESGTRDKGVSDNRAHISPLIGSPWGSGSLVLWVPNPRYIPQGVKSSKSPQCAVKELIYLPAAQTQNTPKANRKRTTKKVRFQLTCSPLTFHPSQQESVPAGQLEVGTGDTSAVVEEPELPRDLSTILVKNKPVVFHSVRERRVRRARQDSPTSLYKLDSKTGEEDIDWDSLRGQSYLWKRHNVPPELLSPPGGTRGTQEIVNSYPVSKASSERTLHSPQCAAPAAWPYVKRAWHYGRDTHPLLSHKKHHQGTKSELDMTIQSTSAVTEHNQLHTMLDTDERRERVGGSKGSVAPLNSEFYNQRSTHQLYSETH
ncbi:uncharacterized protein LOC132892808 isoform X3 [Neoarius graeffei]|uniref:uncharacterized protein LOC132892808 isoform X3 n=1 Tax=Neoarius graeffei TaxID=443677 RepID=UPI00298CE2A0|nr:uncharacterized protein LOC132892808 isoform X3 [Neoarius graeffei]